MVQYEYLIYIIYPSPDFGVLKRAPLFVPHRDRKYHVVPWHKQGYMWHQRCNKGLLVRVICVGTLRSTVEPLSSANDTHSQLAQIGKYHRPFQALAVPTLGTNPNTIEPDYS
jgi:hypothetical protein